MSMLSGHFCFEDGAVTTGQGGQSAQEAASSLVLDWDGRLDNRDDLLIRLGRAHGPAIDDAQIARLVFERWGTDGLGALVGDWSLAIWDGIQRTLHLARDYMGARPLYYCAKASGVWWSGDLGRLVECTGRCDALCDRFAADFMSLRVSADLTPYQDVFRVPTGTCLSFSGHGRTTRRRFWTLGVGEIRYADKRTYEEQLRALWRDAVQTRLRAAGTVWAELSGGLDSSSVVCMADLLIRRGSVDARALRLISHATLHSPEGDERRFIAEVERQVGVQSEIVGVEDNQEHADPDRSWVTPHALQGVGFETVRRIRAAGGRVVLSGRLGDAIMGCQPDNSVAVFDDLARGHLSTGLRNMRAWSRATRKPFAEIASRLLSPEVHARSETGIHLLTTAMRAPLVEEGAATDLRTVRRSKRPLARMVLGYAVGARLDVPHHAPDILYTYPFTHRPLVEFMLAIPGEELSAPGMTRSLMRRAFADLVPARVLRRVSKGYYPPAAFRAARRLAASLLPADRLEVVQRGWIDADRLRSAVRALTEGGGETGGDIHCVLRLERWLEARRAHSAIPQRKEVNTNEVLNA